MYICKYIEGDRWCASVGNVGSSRNLCYLCKYELLNLMRKLLAFIKLQLYRIVNLPVLSREKFQILLQLLDESNHLLYQITH